MPVRAGECLPSLTGYVGEKMYVDLVSMSETIRGNPDMLRAEDSFSRYCWVYLIPQGSMHCGQGVDGSSFQRLQITQSATFINGKEFVNSL